MNLIKNSFLVAVLLLPVMGATAEEESDENLEVAMSYLKAMEIMDYSNALELVEDNVEYINGASPAVYGKDGILNTLQPFFEPIQENEFVILRTATDGDVVFIERLDRHRIPQGWFELPVNSIFEVSNGKITKWREYFDRATIRDAMAELMQ